MLNSVVTSDGPGNEPISFVDDVPSGLKINNAIAGNGVCTVSGQTVMCTISGLPAGASATVYVVVTASSPGTYTNRVGVSGPPGFTDPTPSDNTATATLNVPNAGPTECVVPNLRGTPAKVASRVLKILGCNVNIKRKKGRGVPKGAVLRTKPGAGTYALGQKITLIARK